MKNQTPTWAIIVAVLMMLIGGCGIKNDIQSINIREFLAMKDSILKGLNKSKYDSTHDTMEQTKDHADRDSITSSVHHQEASGDLDTISDEKDNTLLNDSIVGSDNPKGDNIHDVMDSLLNLSEESIVWIIRFGYIGLFFSFLYICSGLFLLIKKRFSISLAYSVLISNVLFSIIKWVMMSSESSGIMKVANSVGSAFSIIGAIILFIVIFSNDKTAYEEVFTDD